MHSYYECSQCREQFQFKIGLVYHCLQVSADRLSVQDADVFEVPTRPIWCLQCEAVSKVEDLGQLREYEYALGMARRGKTVKYPLYTTGYEPEREMQELELMLAWRMGRRNPARALCCGGQQYQLLDVRQPLIKHAECEYGFIGNVIQIGGFNGPRPGTRSPANYLLHDAEGERIGLMTWYHESGDCWDVVPQPYPLRMDDEE